MNGFAVGSYVGAAGIRKIDYPTGVAKLGNRQSKKLENNTYLVRVDEKTLGVKLHETVVVYIHESGNYTLQTGGWKTVTTKDRLNRYSPARISQENNIWYIGDGVFEDGVTVNAQGKPLSKLREPGKVQKAKRKLDKQVLSYIRGFAEHVKANGLKTGEEAEPKAEPWKVVKLTEEKATPLAPSGGDCWACYFGLQHDSPLKEPLGVDHLLQHIEEAYYVPSLLYKAVLTGGGNPGVLWHMIAGDAKRGDTRLLVRALTAYFKKRKPALLELLV